MKLKKVVAWALGGPLLIAGLVIGIFLVILLAPVAILVETGNWAIRNIFDEDYKWGSFQ